MDGDVMEVLMYIGIIMLFLMLGALFVFLFMELWKNG